MQRLCRTVIFASMLVLGMSGGSVPGQPADQAAPTAIQSTMQAFFQALTTVFPLSLDLQQFQDPAHRARILAALQSLAENAEHLETHGQHASLSFDFLRRSLAHDAQQTAERYSAGQYATAQFALHQLTQNCFACHAKLPSSTRFNLGKRFIAHTPLAGLALKERVRLAIATRQFDAALDMYETLFRSQEVSAVDIDLLGACEDYLKIVIRVHQDYTRAIAALTQFRQRPDVPRYLAVYLSDWLEALRTLQARQGSGNVLDQARTLIQEGQLRNRYPADRRGLVHFVVASSLLNRYVDAAPPDPVMLAEAYYLLGVTESSISRSLWLQETVFFLETAIHLAPTAPVAARAYAFLESYILTGFTGSSGTHVPPDVLEHLDGLHGLLGQP